MSVGANGKARVELNGKATKEAAEPKAERLTVTPPNFRTIEVKIIGTAPLVQNRFGSRPRNEMHEAQAAGKRGKSKTKKEAKDFNQCFEDAKHSFEDGTPGIPAAAFRCAMVDACRLANLKMTVAKQAVFVLADGYGTDGTALVRMQTPKPADYFEAPVRLPNGSFDLRARPMYREWSAKVRVQFDADMLSETDVANLLCRAGMQVGIQEGRPFSRDSTGQGWGTFVVEGFDGQADEEGD